MKTLLTAIFSGLFVVALLTTPSQAADAAYAKVESVDGMNVTLMTESGLSKSYPITQESVVAGVKKGDLVWFELNENGKVINIAKAKGKTGPDGKDSTWNPPTQPPKADQPRKGESGG